MNTNFERKRPNRMFNKLVTMMIKQRELHHGCIRIRKPSKSGKEKTPFYSSMQSVISIYGMESQETVTEIRLLHFLELDNNEKG